MVRFQAFALLVMSMFLAACSSVPQPDRGISPTRAAGTPTPSVAKTSAESEHVSPTTETAPSSEPPLDAESVLLTLDDVDDRWTRGEPNERQEGFTTSQRCSDFSRLSYEESDLADVAAMGLFDPRSNDVFMAGQVVRVYPTEREAIQWIRDGNATWRTCGRWREGPTGGTGFPTLARTFRVGRLGDECYGWRETTGPGAYSASTWRVAVRTGSIVSIVEATAPDDVEGLAVYNALHLAEQAQRRIQRASEA